MSAVCGCGVVGEYVIQGPGVLGTGVVGIPCGGPPIEFKTIFGDSSPPGSGNDGIPYTLGVRFQASVPGEVFGLRFYKDPLNTGVHEGALFENDGTELGNLVFQDETPEGWQEQFFDDPIPINADTHYVAAYYNPTGNYSFESGAFVVPITNEPLTAVADSPETPNGVFEENEFGFPVDSFGSTNYFVDVLFRPST